MLQINVTVNTIELVDVEVGDTAISQFFKILNENLQISVCLDREEMFWSRLRIMFHQSLIIHQKFLINLSTTMLFLKRCIN